MTRRAVVVGYGISTVLGEVVVGVRVTCPNGCAGVHHHGWTRQRGTDGGGRSPHCRTPGARGYDLHWPGGVPADVTEALEAGYARSA